LHCLDWSDSGHQIDHTNTVQNGTARTAQSSDA
jgi:hypothetical protein